LNEDRKYRAGILGEIGGLSERFFTIWKSTVDVIATVPEMQRRAEAWRATGRRLALVPTMGALHEGHLSLVRRAREEADHVTVSIFVNPTQFVVGEDLATYPRQIDDDLRALRAIGADAAFVPDAAAMYPGRDRRPLVWVVPERLDEHLCGPHRPGHFRGVTTVVAKLFLACRPHVAVFGLKDAQQFLILRRMAFDLNMGVEMVGMPTYREADGLAASSRNRYLSPDERAQAAILYRALRDAEAAIRAGENDVRRIRGSVEKTIASAPLARVQYVEVVDTEALQPVERIGQGQEVLVAVAAYFGKTRLIDNVFVNGPA
jgi:pantoate--beta-alanine ligase